MFHLTKFQLLEMMFFSIFIFGIGLSRSCVNQTNPCDFENNQSVLILANVMIVLGLTIPVLIWIISSRAKLLKKLRSLKISYVIGIIGIAMLVSVYVFGYLDVNFNTEFLNNDNASSSILWSMQKNAVYIIIFAGIVFLLELRHKNQNPDFENKPASLE